MDPTTMVDLWFFGVCTAMRAWEGLKVCQNVVWVSSGCAMGLELGLGTFAQKALCTVPSSPGSHSGPKNLAKKNSETMVHCRLGIPERRVTGVDARARVRGGRAATTRSRVFLLMHTWVAARCFSSSSPPRTTAAVLGAAARGEPASMATGGTLASAGGPRPPAETGIARAETLGPDGGQRTWKPGPDAAVGQTGAQESMPILFPSPARCSGNNSGGRGGGPRGMDEEGGRPGAGTRHATPPPAGAAAGGRARTIAPYAAPPNGATLKDNNTGLDGGQDNGESSDAAQQHGTTHR